MKIPGEFSCDGDVLRLALAIAAAQNDRHSATLCLRYDREHAARTQRNHLRCGIADQHGAMRGLTGVEPATVNHDLAPGNGVRRIYTHDFRCASHKSCSS